MTYPRIIAATACITALLGAGQARANTPADDAALTAAASYFGTEASCPAAFIEIRDVPLSDAAGRAILGGCSQAGTRFVEMTTTTIWLPAARCATIAHEYGHLIGLEHSSDPASVMNPSEAVLIPACQALLQRPSPRSCRRHHRQHRHRTGCRIRRR